MTRKCIEPGCKRTPILDGLCWDHSPRTLGTQTCRHCGEAMRNCDGPRVCQVCLDEYDEPSEPDDRERDEPGEAWEPERRRA